MRAWGQSGSLLLDTYNEGGFDSQHRYSSRRLIPKPASAKDYRARAGAHVRAVWRGLGAAALMGARTSIKAVCDAESGRGAIRGAWYGRIGPMLRDSRAGSSPATAYYGRLMGVGDYLPSARAQHQQEVIRPVNRRHLPVAHPPSGIRASSVSNHARRGRRRAVMRRET